MDLVEGRQRADIAAIVGAALAGVDPAALVHSALAERPPPTRDVRVVAVGKAAAGMARGALAAWGGAVAEGLVIVPGGTSADVAPPLRVLYAAHPFPDASSEHAARDVVSLLDAAPRPGAVLALVSGGGSALMSRPTPPLSVGDLVTTSRLLMEAGADIRALNTVRRHLDEVKGGRLARVADGMDVTCLVISDVPGDDPAIVASGPFAPDDSTWNDAVEVLHDHGVWSEVPDIVRDLLEEGGRGRLVDPPGTADQCFERVTIRLVGSAGLAAESAAAAAATLGYRSEILDTAVHGLASAVGEAIAERATGLAPGDRPVCLIQAGETTVRVVGTGRGGRNQEVALGAARRLAGTTGVLVAAVGTDGVDGPTDAAGAIATGSTSARAGRLGRSIDAALAANDAYPLLAALDDLIITGPTGTNVMDLHIALAG